MKDKTLIGIRTPMNDNDREMIRDIMDKMNSSSIDELTPRKTLGKIIYMVHIMFCPKSHTEDELSKWNTYIQKMYVPYKH